MSKVERNSIVTLHHQLGYTDGYLLEDSFGSEPMTLHLGRGELAEGLELALLGLEVGADQTLDITPDLAFGFADDNLVKELPRSDFADDFDPSEGLIIEFSTPTGETLPGTIVDFDQQRVKVDFNHPLAGHTVRYRVHIVEVENPPEEVTH